MPHRSDPRLATVQELYPLAEAIRAMLEEAAREMEATGMLPAAKRQEIDELAALLEERYAMLDIAHGDLYALPNGEMVVCDYTTKDGPTFHLAAQSPDDDPDEVGTLPFLVVGPEGRLELVFGTRGAFRGIGFLADGDTITKVKMYGFRTYRFPTPWTVLDLKLLVSAE